MGIVLGMPSPVRALGPWFAAGRQVGRCDGAKGALARYGLADRAYGAAAALL